MATSTFYPQAGAGGANVTCDGYVRRVSVDEPFSTIRAGAGSNHSDTSPNNFAKISASTTSNQFSQIARIIFSFDTSSLSPDVVSAADFSVYGVTKSDTFTTPANPDLVITSSTPADPADLENADYSNTGSTNYGSIGYSSYSTSAYNDIALNASGLSNINTSGVSSFAAVLSNDINNSAPTWNSSATTDMWSQSADQTGTTNDPKLTVTHGAAAGETKAPGVSVGSNHMFIY